MNTENILHKISENADQSADIFNVALASHGGSRSEFSDSLAKEIAFRYFQGRLGFDVADCVINALAGWAPMEEFSARTWAIYRAFDEGEYLHSGQEVGTNEELYTRPLLKKAIFEFFPNEFS
ncbi:hypothetical protein AAKU55_005907 [Oxalobacteraceae bacterium GrIS 1.11]